MSRDQQQVRGASQGGLLQAPVVPSAQRCKLCVPTTCGSKCVNLLSLGAVRSVQTTSVQRSRAGTGLAAPPRRLLRLLRPPPHQGDLNQGFAAEEITHPPANTVTAGGGNGTMLRVSAAAPPHPQTLLLQPRPTSLPPGRA